MPKRFYNPEEELHKTKHNLPHWHQDRSLCFITFRLADSLPAEKLNELKRKKSLWEQAHPKPWDNETIQKRAQVITQLADDYLDQGHGSCLLKHPTFRTILSQAFHHFNGQRYDLDSYVIMPNHVHLLLQLSPDYPVGKIVQSLKRHLRVKYNLTPDAYREKWGLPRDYPMVAPDYARRRSALAKRSGLGKPAT